MNRTRHILRDLRRDLVKNRWIYIMAIPVIAFYILFSYIPMAGVQIAFKDYNFGAGIWGSPWAGLKHFIAFFSLSHKRPTFAFTSESGHTLGSQSVYYSCYIPVAYRICTVAQRSEKQAIQAYHTDGELLAPLHFAGSYLRHYQGIYSEHRPRQLVAGNGGSSSRDNAAGSRPLPFHICCQ